MYFLHGIILDSTRYHGDKSLRAPVYFNVKAKLKGPSQEVHQEGRVFWRDSFYAFPEAA